MPFVVKAALGAQAGAELWSFDEKSMYRGKDVRAGDEIFVFDSDHAGGRGLCARGLVTSAAPGPGRGARLRLEVRPLASAQRRLGRAELKPFRELDDGQPQSEIAWKLYRQATNKVAGVSDAAAAFLRGYF